MHLHPHGFTLALGLWEAASPHAQGTNSSQELWMRNYVLLLKGGTGWGPCRDDRKTKELWQLGEKYLEL